MTDTQAIVNSKVADHLKTILFGADATETLFYTTVDKTPPGVNPTMALLTVLAEQRNEKKTHLSIPKLVRTI